MRLSKFASPILSVIFLFSAPFLAKSQEGDGNANTSPAPELIKQKKSKFKELYTINGLSLSGYKNIAPVLGGIEYNNVRSGIYPGQTEFELTPVEKEQLEHAFGGLFVRELMNWDRFPLVENPVLDSIYLKINLSSVVSFVPSPRARRENEVNKIMSANLNVELFDLRTGHVIMKAEDRVTIKDSNGMRFNEYIWSLEEVQNQFSKWGANLKAELRRFDKKT